jgi:hypothetical protein
MGADAPSGNQPEVPGSPAVDPTDGMTADIGRFAETRDAILAITADAANCAIGGINRVIDRVHETTAMARQRMFDSERVRFATALAVNGVVGVGYVFTEGLVAPGARKAVHAVNHLRKGSRR